MKLVFATNNSNKIKEVQALIPDSITLLSLADINCHEDIPETAPTIEGNAIQKVTYIKEHYNLPCFADDTGLEIQSLDGAPGVYSARYAGPERSAEANMQKVLKNLAHTTDRSAQFKTVIALYLDSTTTCFTGICKGTITSEKRGSGGFGYDPIFLPTGYSETFAQMDLKIKNEIGHRGKAVQELVVFLNQLTSFVL